MDKFELYKLLREFSLEEIDIIFEKSLNQYFKLKTISKREYFIPDKDSVYLIISGKISVKIFLQNNLDFNLEFKERECFGIPNGISNEILGYSIIGSAPATLLEIPSEKLLVVSNTKFLLKVYKLMSESILENFIKVSKLHASKVNGSSDDYLINFLRENNDSISFSSIESLAETLNMNSRTLQRTIKRLTENKTLKKEKKHITLI